MKIKKKLVNIYPTQPITELNPPIRSMVKHVYKSYPNIRKCIIARAKVEEVLPNGAVKLLTLNNYDKENYVASNYYRPEDIVGDPIPDEELQQQLAQQRAEAEAKAKEEAEAKAKAEEEAKNNEQTEQTPSTDEETKVEEESKEEVKEEETPAEENTETEVGDNKENVEDNVVVDEGSADTEKKEETVEEESKESTDEETKTEESTEEVKEEVVEEDDEIEDIDDVNHGEPATEVAPEDVNGL